MPAQPGESAMTFYPCMDCLLQEHVIPFEHTDLEASKTHTSRDLSRHSLRSIESSYSRVKGPRAILNSVATWQVDKYVLLIYVASLLDMHMHLLRSIESSCSRVKGPRWPRAAPPASLYVHTSSVSGLPRLRRCAAATAASYSASAAPRSVCNGANDSSPLWRIAWGCGRRRAVLLFDWEQMALHDPDAGSTKIRDHSGNTRNGCNSRLRCGLHMLEALQP